MITKSDKFWLEENYPDLYFDSETQVIRGRLCFAMYYSANEPGYVLNPDSSYESKDGIVIRDVYEIEIDLSTQGFLPRVREIGGRILRAKEKWGINSTADMHLFLDGANCLCARTEEQARMPNGFNLKDFFENLLISYFYYQSFFEKYGKEPWKGYSHDDLGILESYLNCQGDISLEVVQSFLSNLVNEGLAKAIVDNRQIKGHHFCICGSRKKQRHCHRDAWFGYDKLRNDYRKVKKLLRN